MARGLTHEDVQEELRISISKVLRQEVEGFSLNVRRDLREEFRNFFEECRFNGCLGLEQMNYNRPPSAINRPPSAGLNSRPPSAVSGFSAARNGPSLRKVANYHPPSPPEEDDDENAALRISHSAYLSDNFEQRVSKKITWRIFSRRNSTQSNNSSDQESSPSPPRPASANIQAPRPASASIQPPEQGPPMMFQFGQQPAGLDIAETGPKTLGSLPEEFEGCDSRRTSAENMVKLQGWATHLHPEFRDSRQISKDSSDYRSDSDRQEMMVAPGNLDEDQIIGLPGSSDEAWQQAVTQAPGQIVEVSANGERPKLQRSMTVERMEKMALARERAQSGFDNRLSLKSAETDMSNDSRERIKAYNASLTRTVSEDGIRSEKPQPKRKTMFQRAKSNIRSKLRWHRRGMDSATFGDDEYENSIAKGRHAHHFGRDRGREGGDTMVLRPRVGSIVSDKFDFGTNRKKWKCSKWIAYIVASEIFDYFMGVFLVANAISIGIQVDHNANNNSKEVPFGFRVIETLFCVVFTMELALRVFVYRSAFLSMKGWQWNMFDSAVVIFQLADEFTKHFLTKTKVRGVIDNMGVLRMLRLGRIVRLIRMVRLIPELKSMVYLISASMWSFFWTVVLLVLVMYCFAVYYTEVATDIGTEESLAEKDRIAILAHWGSVSRSILSLYKAITGGDDWVNFIEVFDNPLSHYTLNTLVFCLYMAFAVMVMLNLVTGVFVEGAQRIIREDKDSELIKQVRKLFQLADSDGSNEITWEEFKAQMENRAMDEYFKAVDLSRKEAKDLFKLLDIDHSGSISVEEFVKGCLRLRGPARSVDLAALVYDMNMKHNTVKGHMGFMEKKLEMITDQVTRTCAFLDTCATIADSDLAPEVGTNGMHEFNGDGILV